MKTNTWPAGGRSPRIRAQQHQRGFSIVELMISLVIALLVVLAVVGIYGGSRETFTTQDEVGQMQENIRIAVGIVERTLRQGIFQQIPPRRNQNPLLNKFANPIVGVEGTGTTIGNSDAVQIIFNGSTNAVTATADGAMVDCIGTSIASNVDSRNRFRVNTDATGRPWLACSTDGGTNWTNLVPNIEAMEVLYGLYNGGGTRSVATFVRWSAVTDPNLVVALRVSLLHRSNSPIAAAPSNRTFTLAEQTYGPFTDRFLREATESTITIRTVAQ